MKARLRNYQRLEAQVDLQKRIYTCHSSIGKDEMSSHQHLVTTLAFAAGVLLTLGFKDFYPDLERRFRRQRRQGLTATNEARLAHGIQLHSEQPKVNLQLDKYEIKDGIDGAIGNTPLIRIRSLSERTGCDILAKCEV